MWNGKIENMKQKDQILFSVIIPTFNRAPLLDRCLASLEKQQYRHFEVIVCDDGSKDDTAEIVEKYRRSLDLKYIYNENWGGPAHPRNIGIKHAQAEWLCFLDSDDWWYPEKLTDILPFCKQGYDFIYHDFDLYRKGKSSRKQVKGRELTAPVFYDLFINDNCIANSGVCVRKSVVEAAGGFSEDRELIAVEDYDLWLKCARITEKFKHIPYSLGGYDQHDDNITSNDMRQINRIDRIFSSHKEFLESPQIAEAIINWSYKKGLIFERMKKKDFARRHFITAMKSPVLSIKTKAAIRLLSLVAR